MAGCVLVAWDALQCWLVCGHVFVMVQATPGPWLEATCICLHAMPPPQSTPLGQQPPPSPASPYPPTATSHTHTPCPPAGKSFRDIMMNKAGPKGLDFISRRKVKKSSSQAAGTSSAAAASASTAAATPSEGGPAAGLDALASIKGEAGAANGTAEGADAEGAGGSGGQQPMVAIPSAELLGIKRGAVIGGAEPGMGGTGDAAAAAAGSGPGNTLALRDLIAVMEEDPLYCRHPQLVKLHAVAAVQAAQRR